jgi:hypothetical protein
MQKTSTEAQLLKSNLNAKVFSIGIGSAVSSSNPELLDMSSDPNSYYAHHVRLQNLPRHDIQVKVSK